MSSNHDIALLQSYVDYQLIGSEHCSGAAILDLEGNILAASDGFTFPESKAIASIINDVDALRINGCTFNKIIYPCIHAEPGVFVGRQGANGIAIAKSNNYIIVGRHGEGRNLVNCRMTVENLRDYMVGCQL